MVPKIDPKHIKFLLVPTAYDVETKTSAADVIVTICLAATAEWAVT